jgi:serine/threonine protein kinase
MDDGSTPMPMPPNFGGDAAVSHHHKPGRFNTRKLRITTSSVNVDFINTAGIPSYNFQPGSSFNHYKIVQPQDLSSHEAESWLAEDTRTSKIVLIRVYRRGITPRLEILETLRLMKGQGVSEIYEVGQIQGQHYEVVERVAFGSLREHMDTHRMKEADVRSILADMSPVLTQLHQFGIFHQNICADSILLRSFSPPQFILSNFSLAALGEQSTPDSAKKRALYNTAPEALSGPPNKASDWWSLGMLILEALLGKHPFKDLSETDMLFKIVSQEIKIPGTIPDDWAVLLRGLLNRDPLRRWQDMEVTDWLKGSKQLITNQDFETLTQASSFAYKAITFLGSSYSDLPSLAHALSSHWDSALLLLQSGGLEEWFKADYHDPERQQLLNQILHDQRLDLEQKLMAILLMFSPSMPLSYRGELFHIEWLSKHPAFACTFFESSLPGWIKQLNQEPAFAEWQEFRLELQSQLQTFHVQCDPLKIEEYTLTDAADLNRLHAEFCRRFVSSTNPQLAEILARRQADLAETVLLLSATEDQFLTQEEMLSLKNREEMGQFMDYLFAFDIPMDYSRVQELLSIQPDARLKEMFIERRNRFTGSEHPLLNRIHQKDDPAPVESIAYLITEDAYLIPKPKEQRGLAKVFSGIKRLTRKERDNSVEPVTKIALPALNGHVLQMLFSPDNLEIIVLMEKGCILGFSAQDGRLVRTYQEEGDACEFIALSPHGSYLAAVASGLDHRVHLWDRRGERGKFYLEGNLNEIHAMAFSYDEKEIFSGGVERLVRCWDLETGLLTTKYEGHTYTITQVATNKLYDHLYSSSANGNLVSWNHADQQELFRREEHHYVGKLLFSTDGKLGVSVCVRSSPDHTLRFHYWDSATGEEIQKIAFNYPGGTGEIVYDASPSLDYFLIAEAESMLLVSLQGEGNLLRWKLARDQKPYTKIVFSGHGLRVCTCNGDNELALWNLYEIYELE